MQDRFVDGGRGSYRPEAFLPLYDEGVRYLQRGDAARAAERLSRLVRTLLREESSTERSRDALRQAVRGLGLCLEALEEQDGARRIAL
ncbi:MAG: hypothetical protein QME94_14370, partial [Anaerolineae bacterium]|nr:hypothetical protein [Anaerolineae bacterium]